MERLKFLLIVFMVVQTFNLLKYLIQSLLLRIIALLIVLFLLRLAFLIILLKFLFFVFGHVLHFNAFIFLFQFEQFKKMIFPIAKSSINITSRRYHSSPFSIFFYLNYIVSFVLFPCSVQKFQFGFFIC
jgi:hypothetical protein